MNRVHVSRGCQRVPAPCARFDKLVQRLLHTLQNAAAVTNRCRAYSFGHRPAFAAELLEDDPVAFLQSLPNSAKSPDCIDLCLCERKVRASASSWRKVGTVTSAESSKLKKLTEFVAGGKLRVGYTASRVGEREGMLSDVAIA